MKKILFWIIAVLITLSSVVYQRLTGPTHPLRGMVAVGDEEVRYRLPRSHETTRDCRVEIAVADREISGHLLYKRFKTDDLWTEIPLMREEDKLAALLPKQPPAGKLAYQVILEEGEKETSLTGEQAIIIRFKGEVPGWALIPHIIIMFAAMLVSTRAGLAALDRGSNPRKYALWAAGLLFAGGMILGPIVQKFAFGAYWTGFPFGTDLTDNKTLVSLLFWIAALVAGRGGKPARGWVLGAAVVTLVIYFIPHSLLGSELDYSTLEPGQ